MRVSSSRWAAAASAVLALVVVGVVARSGRTRPFALITASSVPSQRPRTLPTPSPLTNGATSSPRAQGLHNTASHLTLLLVVVFVVGTLVLAALVVRFTRPRRAARHVDGAGETPTHLTEPTSAELSAAVGDGLDWIERGAVSDAIIACWLRVERTGTQVGVRVRAAETSAEYVARVLHTHGARADSLRRLAELYREARFSDHSMTEQDRQDARDCLRAIHADLGASRAER